MCVCMRHGVCFCGTVCGCENLSLCDFAQDGGDAWQCVCVCLYTFKKWNISFGSVSEAVSQLRLREAGGRLLGYENRKKENEKVKSGAKSYPLLPQPSVQDLRSPPRVWNLAEVHRAHTGWKGTLSTLPQSLRRRQVRLGGNCLPLQLSAPQLEDG